MKPGKAPLKSIRLLDQVRERIRYLHYSLSTEKACLNWVKLFARWNGCRNECYYNHIKLSNKYVG
jgi:hypothetical protein